MQRTSNTRLTTFLLALSCLVASCGGGGGGGGGGQNPNGPAVNAGADTTVAERDRVTLNGTATQNPNGDVVTTYLWEQVAGTPVTLMNADQITATFVAMDLGANGAETLTFRFTATDAMGQASSDDIAVTVADARTAGGVAIYLASMNNSNQIEVFAADTRGTDPTVMISGGVQHTGSTEMEVFALSPDEKWFAYITDERIDNLYEIYIARTDGSGSTLAHAPLANNDSVGGNTFAWSPVPDSVTGEHRLAFLLERGNDNKYELYTTIPGTGIETKVSGPISASGGDVQESAWAPDGSRIAYVADADQNGLDELFTTLPDSDSNAVKISPTLQSAGDVTDFAWSPRSDQVAFRADAQTDNKFELFVSGATSSGATKVSQPIQSNRSVQSVFEWTPDASADPLRIAYLVDEATDNLEQLFTTTPDGTDRHEENGPLVANGEVSSFAWSPDGVSLAYTADQLTDNVHELFVATAGSSTMSLRISGPMVTNGDVISNRQKWSPTGAFVSYIADQNTDGVTELFVARPDGSEILRASGTMGSGGDVFNELYGVQWSPDGSRIAYLADQNENGVNQLFTSDPTLGFTSNTVVSGRPIPGGYVEYPFTWSRDGGRLLYVSNQNVTDAFDLFSTGRDFEPTLASENPKLSGSLPMDTNGNTTGRVYLVLTSTGPNF